MDTLQRAAIATVPVALVVGFSIRRFTTSRGASALLQLLGSVCLAVVVLIHVAEGLRLFPEMGWGEPHSIGHDIDLTSTVLAVTLLLAAALVRGPRGRHRLDQ